MDNEFNLNPIISYFKKNNINIMEPLMNKELQFRPEATKELYLKKIWIIFLGKYIYYPKLNGFDNKMFALITYNANIKSISSYIKQSVLRNIHLAIDDNNYKDFNKYPLSNNHKEQYNNYLTQNKNYLTQYNNNISIKKKNNILIKNKLNNKTKLNDKNKSNNTNKLNNKTKLNNTNKLNNKTKLNDTNKLNNTNILNNTNDILIELKNKILKIEKENKNNIKKLNIKILNNENEIIVLKNDIIELKKENNYLKNTLKLNIFI